MRRVLPPKDVSPQKLFRLVTDSRPKIDIAHRVRDAEHVALGVRAITPRDWAESAEDTANMPRFYAEIVARALLADGSLAFRSADEAAEMDEDCLTQLGTAVVYALYRISPPRWMIEEGEWHTVLRAGALHASNQSEAFTLGTSYDVAGTHVLDRPERFYGLPARDLTDLHWLAYRVCRRLIDEASK